MGCELIRSCLSVLPTVSDGHDKPFCTKVIIDNFKKALGDTDNR